MESLNQETAPGRVIQPELSEDQMKLARMNAIKEEIRLLYDSGTLLFTRALLRKAADMIDAVNNGQTVQLNIKGINNVEVTLSNKVNTTNCRVRYHCIESLVKALGLNDLASFNPKTAYVTINTSVKLSAGPRKLVGRKKRRRALKIEVTKLASSERFEDLSSYLQAHPLPKVNKIVAFGRTPLHSELGVYWTVTQVPLMLAIRYELACDRDLACFAQDVAYTDAEKVVLDRRGVKVLSQPRALLEVDEETILISIKPSIPLKQIIADIVKPAIIIWDRRNNSMPKDRDSGAAIDRMDLESARVESLLQGYDMMDSWAENFVVYIRRPDCEGL